MKSFYSNEQIFKSINRAKQCLFVPADKETAAPEAELQEWQRAGIPVDEVLGCAGAGAISGSSTSPTHGGMNRAALRPAVVLAVAYGGMTVVVPPTTTPVAFGFPHTHGIERSSGNGLISSSAALVFQIVALSEDRFVKKDRAVLGRGYGNDKRSFEGPVGSGVAGRYPLNC